jgi:adenylate cyclase
VSTRRRLSGEFSVPEEQILKALPELPAAFLNTSVVGQRQRARPAVKLEPFKVVSAGASATEVAVHVASKLNALLWRNGCCEVVEDEIVERHQLVDSPSPDFAIRGEVVRNPNAVFLAFRVINLRLGTVVWSCHEGLRDPTPTDVSAWVEGAVEAIATAVGSAPREVDNTNDIRKRLFRATTLAGALEPQANQQALQLLNEILAEDAKDSTALALTSWCYAQRAVYNWSSNPDRERLEARYYAAAATHDGIDDARVLSTIATARMLIKEGNAAQILLERALRLNNKLPLAYTRSGWLANYVDEPELGARHFQRAIKLAPLDPMVFNAYAGLGAAHFIQGDYVQAVRRMEQALALNPKALWIQRNLVPAYAAAGDRRSAKEGVEALMKGYPRLTVDDIVSAVVFSAPVLAKIAVGLRESGLPA